MAMSIPRPDPSSPSAVAAAAFTTSRRGFEQTEVREFLRMVAAELARLQEREAFLERELRTAQRTNAGTNIVLDDELVTRMLGEEATRVLQTAREGSAQIKSRAEEGAARLLREATDEAQRLREEAEVEAARKRNDAAADAEAELQMAKQQGRDMVNEARDYRERVLSELARRREIARQQIEQLVHGRERLLQAFERARLVSIDVMAELTPLGQPDEFVNLAPTTGPIPLMVPASAATPTRIDPVVAEPETSVGETVQAEDATVVLARPEVEPEVVPEVEHDVDEPIVDTAVDDVEMVEMVEIDVVDVDVVDMVEVLEVDELDDAAVDEDETFEMIAVVDVVDDAGDVQHYDLSSVIERLSDVDAAMDTAIDAAADQPEDGTEQAETEPVRLDIEPAADLDVETDHGDGDDEREPAPVVALFGGDGERSSRSAEARATKPSVDELFARLRASRTDTVARRASADPAVAVVTTELVAAAAATAEPTAEPIIDAAAPSAPTTPEVAPAGEAREDSVFFATPDAPAVTLEVDDTPFARRDEALTPIIVGAARRLKRVLADEQNEVLHTLRRNEPVRSVDVLVAAVAEHVGRYNASIDADLLDAALAGAGSMGVDASGVRREFVRGEVTRTAQDVLAAELVQPLRDRLARAVNDADGDNGELATLVRTVYREWKNQRIDEQLDDIVQTAFGRGAFTASKPGTPIRWIVDPKGPPCADAEDNALAGIVEAGQPFPTDHPCAPAHRGCRCMIAPAT